MKKPETLLPPAAVLPAIPRSPLPDPARSPVILLLTIGLTHPWLILLNLRSYGLMAGEMTPAAKHLAWMVFAAQVLLFLGSAALAWKLCRRKSPIPWHSNWAIFVPHLAFLMGVSMTIIHGHLIPNSVAAWIVPPGTVLFHQWVFLMPAIFYSGLVLACLPSKRSRLSEATVNLLALVIPPVLLYLSLQITRFHTATYLWLVIAVGATLVCLAGFLRIMTSLYVWVHGSNRAAHVTLACTVGLLLPLVGLFVNERVPFPTDFQSPLIYALAIINGLLLIQPTTNRPGWDRFFWLARCVTFPFTAYFFLVFLPFLPLAIPAMLAAGAGFLLLAPTALFIFHGRLLADALRMEMQDGMGKKALPLALVAALILPAGVSLCAMFDRQALGTAMNFVFTPDYREDTRLTAQRWAVAHSLRRLQAQKEGIYLPFLSEFYNLAVFNGLTVSDAKMQTLHKTFFGTSLKPGEQNTLFSRGTVRREPQGGRERPGFQRDIRLESLKVSRRIENGNTVTTATLQLQNLGSEIGEYVTTIQLPPGVLVSGYALHVGEERVPGQIFEKKSALWVYRMIRDVTRRDPGILTYQTPDTVELRIFPFEARQARTTEIEFLSPPGLHTTVKIGDRTVEIENPSRGIPLVRHPGRTQAIFAAEETAPLPATVRKPYLHFIVDRSVTAKMTPTQIVDAIHAASKNFPGITDCMVTAANYEISDLSPHPIAMSQLEELTKQPMSRWLPTRGALLANRAMKRSMLRYHDTLAVAASPEEFLRYPIFVIVKNPSSEMLPDDDMADFTRLVPDTDGYYIADIGGTPKAVPFVAQASMSSDSRNAVYLVRHGRNLDIVPVNLKGSAIARFDTAATDTPLEVYDQISQTFTPIGGVIRIADQGRYVQGVELQEHNAELIENPSRFFTELPGLVKESKASGILLPDTSYIVVENSAQWQILKLKEKQKLTGNKSLDFMEAPEPGVGLMALGALVVLIVANRFPIRKRFTNRDHRK